MSIAAIVVALVWGAIAGYLLIRLIDNLAAAGLCVDGLLREGRRSDAKPSKGRVNSSIVLRLMLRVILYAVLCGVLLLLGHSFVQREFGFEYAGAPFLVFLLAVLAMAASRLSAVRERLKIIWRMSHEPNYAEKRRRTQMLRR